MDAGRAGAAGSSLTVLARLAFVVKIVLVPDEKYRDIVLVLWSKGLSMESAGFLARFPGGCQVHQEESFSGDHVLIPYDSI